MTTSNLQEHRKTIYFKIDGKAFQDGIDIHATASALRDFQTIIDRSYLALIDENKIRAKNRFRHKLIAQGFEEGSFGSPADIVIETIISAVVYFGPEKVWEYAKTAFELLGYVYSRLKDSNDKKNSPITINGDGNTIIINQGSTSYEVERPVFNLAQQMRPIYKNISKSITSNEIEYFQIGSKREKPEIRIDKSNAKLFNLYNRVITDPVEAVCEILSYNKKTGYGKLRVLSSREIPDGEYPFSVSKHGRNNFLPLLSEDSISVFCQREMSIDPFEEQESKILKLHFISLSESKRI